jgi:molybdenum cofactor synthesis domain-containing protein
MSTGNELVDSSETPVGNQVRDSNRLSLIASCIENGQQYIDLGIVGDSKEELRRRLLEASLQCDIVVSSGGVSMGAADFVKPLLKEIGTVHFAKLNMKPGKPTTFASFVRDSESGRPGQTLFFGLPGNPVSCLVTKALFVDPAVRRLQGLDSEACLHPQLTVTLAGSSIKLDPERPEYHRAILVANETRAGVVSAYSTGNQRSSRLLSMLSANALLFLPRGPGTVEVGSTVQALLIRPMTAAPKASSVHPSAALLDTADEEDLHRLRAGTLPVAATLSSRASIDRSTESLTSLTDLQRASGYMSFPRGENSKVPPIPSVEAAMVVKPAAAKANWRDIKVGLLTISDRVSDSTV